MGPSRGLRGRNPESIRAAPGDKETRIGRRTSFAHSRRSRLRSPRPGAGCKRQARAGGQPLAVSLGALWKFLHPAKASKESQPAHSGWATGPSPTANSISRTETSGDFVIEGLAGSSILLGALVYRLQSRGPRHRSLAAG